MRTLKKIFKITALTVTLLMLLLGGTMIYLYYHQEKLIQPIVGQINKQLIVEVDVADIELSFRQFPMISVAFSNVFIPEALPGSKDTLISVEKAYLSFRPWDVWRDDMHVSGVSLNNGKVYLRTLPNGQNNWSFWKSSDSESSVSIGLHEVIAKDVRFRYQSKDVTIEDYVESIKLTGNFSDSELSVEGKGEVAHRRLRVSDFTYDRPVFIKADFNVQKDGEGFGIKSKRFSLDGEPVSLRVFVEHSETDIHIEGQNLNATSVYHLLPENYRKALDWLEVEGSIDMEFAARLPEHSASERQLIYTLKNGSIRILDRDLTIHRVNTNGELLFGSDVRSRNGLLEVTHLEGQIDDGRFQLDMRLEDFNQPLLSLNANAQLSLEKLFVMTGLDTLENVQGKASFECQFQNRFQSLSTPTARDFVTAQSSGTLRIDDGAFYFKNSDLPYKNVSAVCSLQKNDLYFDTLTIVAGSSDLGIKGRLKNLLPYLLVPGEKVQLEADAHSKHLKLDELLAAQGQSSEPYSMTFPKAITAKLNAQVEDFQFEKFQAKGATGTCLLSPSGLQALLSDISTLGGKISRAELYIDGKQTPYKMQLLADGSNIDMNALFTAFNNFGQDVITARELHGTLTASIRLSALLTPALDIPTNSISADATVQLDKGRLVHFEPMEALSRFARIEELRDVRFDRLSNTLRIDKGIIYIPTMDIRSNVINLELEGTHSFENIIDYTVRMDLREALFAERKRKKSEFDDIMVISEESGARLWVTMKGPASDPRISLDNRQIRRTLGDQFREQGRQLRGEEKPKPKPEYEFEFDW